MLPVYRRALGGGVRVCESRHGYLVRRHPEIRAGAPSPCFDIKLNSMTFDDFAVQYIHEGYAVHACLFVVVVY